MEGVDLDRERLGPVRLRKGKDRRPKCRRQKDLPNHAGSELRGPAPGNGKLPHEKKEEAEKEKHTGCAESRRHEIELKDCPEPERQVGRDPAEEGKERVAGR